MAAKQSTTKHVIEAGAAESVIEIGIKPELIEAQLRERKFGFHWALSPLVLPLGTGRIDTEILFSLWSKEKSDIIFDNYYQNSN